MLQAPNLSDYLERKSRSLNLPQKGIKDFNDQQLNTCDLADYDELILNNASKMGENAIWPKDYNRIHNLDGIQNLMGITSIKRLKITNNDIRQINHIDTLLNMETLDLSGNIIVNIEGMSNLVNLRELHLCNNKINKIQGLDKLKKLEVLDLCCNKIEKIEGLDNLVNLKVLDLSNRQILAEFSAVHFRSSQREEKWVRHLQITYPANYTNRNKITDIDGLDPLINLENLDLSGNNIRTIRVLDRLNTLKGLYLSRNQIEEIGQLPDSLVELCLDQNQINKIQNLQNLKKLEILNLSKNNIRRIEGLDGLDALEDLYLKNNDITSVNLDDLGGGFDKNGKAKDTFAFKWYSRTQEDPSGKIAITYGRSTLKIVNRYTHELTLEGSFFGMRNLSKIGGLEKLRDCLYCLDLSDNSIVDTRGLPQLDTLEKLILRENRIKRLRGLATTNDSLPLTPEDTGLSSLGRRLALPSP